MDVDEALAGQYVGVMLATIATWIACVATGVVIGGVYALHHL